ncbi:hypothetical protein L6452_08198 [Arctium lappa]|uniref:Uncharacterized protein n=1 Tax=Arctium lappa TaxID=4217 RepID=A0ACB9DGN2_ARCLA|nr:hypothetical protein L6452_08198 [Arctium lappa]
MRNGGERKRSLLKRLCTRNRTNADPEEWVWAFEKMNMQRVRWRFSDGEKRHSTSIKQDQEQSHTMPSGETSDDCHECSPRGRVQEGTDSEKEEAWHEIGGGRISDSELLDSMDGGRALQLKHEINVESTTIQRGTTKRDRDQPLVYRVNLVRSILREKKDGNEWEDWSSLFISRKELVSTSLIRRTNKKRLTV